jgi:hypothetical protein
MRNGLRRIEPRNVRVEIMTTDNKLEVVAFTTATKKVAFAFNPSGRNEHFPRRQHGHNTPSEAPST